MVSELDVLRVKLRKLGLDTDELAIVNAYAAETARLAVEKATGDLIAEHQYLKQEFLARGYDMHELRCEMRGALRNRNVSVATYLKDARDGIAIHRKDPSRDAIEAVDYKIDYALRMIDTIVDGLGTDQ